MRVCIAPSYQGPDRADGGIRRVVEAQVAGLSAHGIQVVEDARDADIVACHGTTLLERPGRPMVAHCHGLYWHDYDWPGWADAANARVIDVLVRAAAVTAPSRWVAGAISRGMLVAPTVIYHGVDTDAWAPGESQGFVLWNKARTDAVSDPAAMDRVAGLLPQVPFVSTFGAAADNVQLLGARPVEEMRQVVQAAGVYLATARETFGIGTLEALACGVPVVGWRYGGQEEIIIEGETGYLVEPGDDAALAQAIERALRERDRLSRNARADALTRWQWHDKIAQYAALYARVARQWDAPQPRVSVVVTCHNLARFLPDAVASVEQQTLADWELLIIDDESTDETPALAQRLVAAAPTRMRSLRTPGNLRLSGARNFGAAHATGRYLLFLDADDMLEQNALDVLSTALDQRSDIHIAYGHLDLINEDGVERRRNAWPFAHFDWHGQMAHLNQLPYAALWRRSAFVRTGGYRVRDWRAEDAALWCRATSFGLRAEKVTDAATLLYRLRSDSKSAEERQRHRDRDGDWTAMYPWSTAHSGTEGVHAQEQGIRPSALLVPWGAQGQPRDRKAWPVRHHQHPAVSVIIPVGPDHAHYVIDALDSLIAQTCPEWEAIVVNDTGARLELPGHPWAQLQDTPRLGAGHARNIGLAAARAPLVLFLDADDALTPRALEAMLERHMDTGGAYIYSDWSRLTEDRFDGDAEYVEVPEYDQAAWLQRGQHAVTALIPTAWARDVGGFDETMPGWEDWDFFIKLAVAGYCGARLPEATLIYRLHTGRRREVALGMRDALTQQMYSRYAAYGTGERAMAGCGGCSSTAAVAQRTFGDPAVLDDPVAFVLSEVREGETVRMEYIGPSVGEVSFIGRGSGRVYRAGNNAFSRFHDADPRDVPYLAGMDEEWRVVVQRRPAEARR